MQLTTIRPCRPRRGDARPILLGCPNAFFEADAVPIEEPPNRTDAGLLLTFIKQATLNLLQRQVGFLPHQFKQPFLLFERRPALAFDRFDFKAAGFPPALHQTDRR